MPFPVPCGRYRGSRRLLGSRSLLGSRERLSDLGMVVISKGVGAHGDLQQLIKAQPPDKLRSGRGAFGSLRKKHVMEAPWGVPGLRGVAGETLSHLIPHSL